ncbi:MAG: hypothetical protein ACI9C4_002622 [Paraglaciecola sp.]|jgi:hypothetical protein
MMIYVFLINSLMVALAVIVHYQCLYRLTLFLPTMAIKHSYRIVFGVFGALLAHTVEVWIFAVAYYFMDQAQGWGHLTGNFNGSLMDCAYFSFTVFSTVGFGDIEPFGDLRYLTGIESLTGLVLITWTASFLFFEMQRHWNTK